MDKIINKSLYKLELTLLKYTPITLALAYVIYTTCAYFDITITSLSYFAHLSIIPWLFIFISSLVFGFCRRHRVPLWYIAINDLITVIGWYIPESSLDLLLFIHIIVTIIFFIIYIFMFIHRNKSIFKPYLRRINRAVICPIKNKK